MQPFSMTTLIRNFIILAYADLFNKRQYDILGTTLDYKSLLCYSYDYGKSEYRQKAKIDFEHKIYAVLSGDFEGNGKTSIVVIQKDADNYKNSLVTFEIKDADIVNYKVEYTKDTRTPPFVIANPKNASASLLLETQDGICIGRLQASGEWEYINESSLLDNDEHIDELHTSTLVDLTGDLKPDLCLFVKKNGTTKWLKVFKVTTTGFDLLFKKELSSSITGPVLFGDFTRSGLNSMLYMSKEANGVYYINLMINNGRRQGIGQYKSSSSVLETNIPNDEIFVESSALYKKIPMSDIARDVRPMLLSYISQEQDEKDASPAGIYVTDIDLDGYLEVFVTVKDINSKHVILPLKYSTETNSYKLYEEVYERLQMDNVFSMSTIDYNNSGKENIILNRWNAGIVVLECHENEFNRMNMKLSLSTIALRDKYTQYGMSIPGASYMIVYNNGSNYAISTNFSSGPFLHLVSQTATIGFGDSAFVINTLAVGLPVNRIYKDMYIVDASIIQNFDLIVYVGENGYYKIEAFFNLSKYTYRIVIVLSSVIFANLILFLFLYWQNHSKQKLERAKDNVHPLFRSL